MYVYSVQMDGDIVSRKHYKTVSNAGQLTARSNAILVYGFSRPVEGVQPVIIMSERAKYIDVALIYELWREYATAVNDGDLDQWIWLWVEHGIQMLPNEPPRIGKEQIYAAMKLHLDQFLISNMVINTEEVQILGDRAYAYGTYNFKRVSKEGGPKMSCSGNFLDILEKQVDCSWKIAIDCRNCSESYE